MLFLFFQQAGGPEPPTVAFPVLFVTLVLTIFILWRRYRSRRLLIERVAELEALSDAGRALVAAELDIVALCELISREAANIIDARTFQIGLFEGTIYRIFYWTIDGEKKETPKVFDLSERRGLVGWVRDSKRSLLVRDFAKEMDALPARPRYVSDQPPISAIFIPLLSGEETIGLVAAQSSQPNAFSQRDLGHLTILANQAAAAIANGKMYDRERRRAAQLELVGQIARRVNVINDLDELLSQVVTLTQETFDYGSVNVFGIDPESGSAVIQASSITGLSPGALQLTPGTGLIGSAVASQETTLSNNVSDDVRFLAGDLPTVTHSEIAIPLIVDQELLGVLDVQSEELGAFTSQEKTVLEALGAQVAIAIHKAQQFALQREQTWITIAQLQVAETIGQSADLESLAESLVRLTPLLVGVAQCTILLWDSDQETYHGAAAFGLPKGEDDSFDEMTLAIGDWKALDAVHVGHEILATRREPPWSDPGQKKAVDSASYGATVLYPLVAKARLLGVLVISGEGEPGIVSADAGNELLRNIASQASQAIDNMRLQLAQQEEAWVNTALLQVAEAVSKLTDLNEILYTIVRMVPMLVGVKSCIVLIWEEDRQVYRAGPSFGLTEMGQGLLESFEVEQSEFALVDTHGVERIGPDASYSTFKLPEWMDTISGSETADIVPLYARARLVGALLVGPAANARPLTGRRLNIVTGIAQQAAVAVVNDQLYKESAERSRLEQELDVARSIQASLIPPGDPDIPGCSVAGFWQAAREVSGDFYDFMPFSDGSWGIAIADVADKGVPAALFMALSRTILRTVAFNRRSPSVAMERANQIIYGDTSSDLFVTVFYAVWKPDTETLTFASGGHNPPVLIQSNGDVSLLRTDGVALGILENVQIAQKVLRLHKGDVIVFYTDGVTEAMNEDFDEFGMERLCLVVKNAQNGDAADIVKAIRNSIDDHVGNNPQFDDITLVVMKH
jgi:serine phosphatase RsbU (regulator of sigma subunit)/putative methionine-R-sulfoxide reductase with GAF domain